MFVKTFNSILLLIILKLSQTPTEENVKHIVQSFIILKDELVTNKNAVLTIEDKMALLALIQTCVDISDDILPLFDKEEDRKVILNIKAFFKHYEREFLKEINPPPNVNVTTRPFYKSEI